MKYFRTATALAALFLLMPGRAAAEASPQARITVAVVNNTGNGTTTVGDEVTLQLYRDRQQTDLRQATVGQDGKAIFESIPTGQDVVAVAHAKHQNMAFGSQPVPLSSASSDFSVGVQVFDVSADASKLSVGVHHIMIAVRAASLEFTEYMQLTNGSDMAVIGSKRDDRNRPSVIEVKLPEGFRDLAASGYLEMEALVVTADGFHDTMAVPPGEHQVAFSYKADIDRSTVKIVKEVALPTSELMIFWEHGQGRLEGLGEPNGRLTNAEGVPMEYYRRSDLKPGDKVAFQISGFSLSNSNAHTWIVLGAVFATIVAIALLRSRPKPFGSGQRHA